MTTFSRDSGTFEIGSYDCVLSLPLRSPAPIPTVRLVRWSLLRLAAFRRFRASLASSSVRRALLRAVGWRGLIPRGLRWTRRLMACLRGLAAGGPALRLHSC